LVQQPLPLQANLPLRAKSLSKTAQPDKHSAVLGRQPPCAMTAGACTTVPVLSALEADVSPSPQELAGNGGGADISAIEAAAAAAVTAVEHLQQQLQRSLTPQQLAHVAEHPLPDQQLRQQQEEHGQQQAKRSLIASSAASVDHLRGPLASPSDTGVDTCGRGFTSRRLSLFGPRARSLSPLGMANSKAGLLHVEADNMTIPAARQHSRSLSPGHCRDTSMLLSRVDASAGFSRDVRSSSTVHEYHRPGSPLAATHSVGWFQPPDLADAVRHDQMSALLPAQPAGNYVCNDVCAEAFQSQDRKQVAAKVTAGSPSTGCPHLWRADLGVAHQGNQDLHQCHVFSQCLARNKRWRQQLLHSIATR
jgi:hypothetical protein